MMKNGSDHGHEPTVCSEQDLLNRSAFSPVLEDSYGSLTSIAMQYSVLTLKRLSLEGYPKDQNH